MRSKVRPMNELLHSLSLYADQNQWQCENARPRLSGKFPYDMKGVSAVPRANCLGEAAAPEFTVSKIVSEGNEEERGNQPDLIIQVSTQNQRLAVSDGWIMNGWKDGLACHMCAGAQELEVLRQYGGRDNAQ